MKKTVVSLALLLAASVVFADGLSKKYKVWDRSPEAYFLTSSEREQWKKVRTDADAQNFILDYKARRGPDSRRCSPTGSRSRTSISPPGKRRAPRRCAARS